MKRRTLCASLIPLVAAATLGWLCGRFTSGDEAQTSDAEDFRSPSTVTAHILDGSLEDDESALVTIDYEAGCVVKRSPSGEIAWTFHGDVGGVRPPHLLFDPHRVYVTDGDGVTALDLKTGKQMWHAAGPALRMCLSDDWLLATGSRSAKDTGEWLVARAAATGKEVMKVQLSTGDFDPMPIEEIAGLFLVQGDSPPDGVPVARLFDRHGKVRLELFCQIVDGISLDEKRVFLTTSAVVCFDPTGKLQWNIGLRHGDSLDRGRIIKLQSGDLIVFLYGPIHDSGVRVMRLNPVTGKPVWRAYCEPLGVGHDAYDHRAKAEVLAKQLKITSRGADTFVELLDLQSGKRVKRTGPPRPKWGNGMFDW
jgi:outer membrane protein assembly factor BamB